MICPRCGKPIQPDATNAALCPSCGARLDLPAYVPPPPEEQASAPTTPYARSAYMQPPIMKTVPLISPLPAPTPAESAQPEEADWSTTPPLLTTTEPEEIPFAMTAAPDSAVSAVAETPASEPAAADAETAASETEETAPESDGLPDYETPDVERPAIILPKPPLPDYDTPDVERTAVHPATPQPEPEYDTPDVERPTVHPIGAHLTPLFAAEEMATGNGMNGGSAGETSSNGTGTPPNAIPTYPDDYSGPKAGHFERPLASPSDPPSAAAYTPPPTSDDPVERIFGVQPPPAQRSANNVIQRLWKRHIPPHWAANPWVSILVGALAALVLGLLATAIMLIFWSPAVGYLLDSSGAIDGNRDLIQAIFAPNLLQLYLLAHGIPMALSLGAPGATGSFAALESLPLTGVSLTLACALVIGGYVAAASDFTHRLRYSVLRGALIGPLYAVLLALVALFGRSTVMVAQNTIIQLQPSIGQAFLTGLIWGIALGALGGLLAVRSHHLFTTNRRPDLVAGAAWGALIALGSGLLLALVALAAGMAAQAVGTVPTSGGSSGLFGVINGVFVTISLFLVLAPVGALWLFALGTGATVDTWLSASGISNAAGSTSVGLLAAQHHPSSIVWWLLLLVPLASYVIGGRAAAHIARPTSLRESALAGGLMAVALSILLLVLTLLSRLLIYSQAISFGRAVSTSLGIGPSVGAVFLLVLLVGGLVGTLAGISVWYEPQLGPVVSMRVAPLLVEMEPMLSVARRPWDAFDASRGRFSYRSPLRVLIYAAVLLAVVLLALFLIVLLIGLLLSLFLPIGFVRGFDGFFAGLAVGVPLLLLACAAILYAMETLPPILTAHTRRAY